MKVLSNKSIYGLRALVYITSQGEKDTYVNIREMSEQMDISFHFLTKILQQLTSHGILQSYRGPKGGVTLAKPAKDVFMIDIVHLFEGDEFFDTCFLGLPNCGEDAPCPMHQFWSVIKEQFLDRFENTSLEELSTRVLSGNMRL